MFDKIRRSLGMNRSFEGSGERLGDGKLDSVKEAQEGAVALESSDFDLKFAEQTLGLQFVHPLNIDGSPDTHTERPLIVQGTAKGSEAEMLGIQKGDTVLSVEGNTLTCYDDFAMIVKALERPITIKFRRVSHSPPLNSAEFQVGRLDERAPQQNVFNMSANQKDARRAAMQAAAENRANAWNRKVKAGARAREDAKNKNPGSTGGIHAHPEAAAVGNFNPTTQQAARMAQAHEQYTAEKMGYNPYQPTMSASAGSGSQGSPRGGGGDSSHLRAVGLSKSSSHDVDISVEDNYDAMSESTAAPSYEEQEQVDLALSLLLSSGLDEEAVTTCVGTLVKLVGNVITSNGAAKFCRIKKGNATIQTKVLTIPGGEELLLSAGFQQEMDNDEAILKHSWNDATQILAIYVLRRLQQLK
jgi:hypothetical protein